VYKGKSRFLQSMTSKGRRLSGYPKSRKLVAAEDDLMSGQPQFEIGTVYIKQISPLIHQFIQSGLTDAIIADELRERGIATPSGRPWTKSLAADLVQAIRLSDRRRVKGSRRTGRTESKPFRLGYNDKKQPPPKDHR
jgi:hypothetical protein